MSSNGKTVWMQEQIERQLGKIKMRSVSNKSKANSATVKQPVCVADVLHWDTLPQKVQINDSTGKMEKKGNR